MRTAAELKKAVAFLAERDDSLAQLASRIELEPIASHDPWWELVDSIISQQLSLQAASTISGRVKDLFGGVASPEALRDTAPERLRAAGLSGAKVRYVQNLAARVTDGRLDLAALEKLSDEGVVATLTEVKGIGRWTAEMFLIFHLGRADVLPVDDLGFREATKRAYDLSERPGAPALTELGERWRPYRSVATRLLWKSLALETPTDARARPE